VEPEATSACGPFLTSHPDGIVEIVFDDPSRSVNVLTVAVMTELEALVASLQERAGRGGLAGVVFRSGKSTSFLAGADLDAMDAVTTAAEAEAVARRGQRLFGMVASLPVPTLAAVHGACVGGGTELALACRRRIVSDDPRSAFSLPEVRLGILPAWGGTTRLPATIGLLPSLSILLTGRAVRPVEARRLGLVDAVLPAARFLEPKNALSLAREYLRASAPRGRKAFPSGWAHLIPGVSALALRQARQRILRETGGSMPAPLAILDILKETGGRAEMPIAARGFALEARGLGELLPSAVSRNLRHLFHLSQAARRRPERPSTTGAPPPGVLLVEGPRDDDFVSRARGRGLEVRVGPLTSAVLAALPGGPDRWLITGTPEQQEPDGLPPPWGARWVGLGRPTGVREGPLLELALGSHGSEEERSRTHAEAHAIALALGGVPMIGGRPGGATASMVRAFSARARGPTGSAAPGSGHEPDAEFLACLRIVLALDALAECAFRDAGSVDLAMVLAGIAPPWEGGPLRAADEAGLPEVITRLEEATHRWKEPLLAPPPLLRTWAAAGTSLYTLDRWGGPLPPVRPPVRPAARPPAPAGGVS